MEKTEIGAIIKYLHLQGMTASEIHDDMLKTLAESAPSYATVTRWTREFKRGRDSVEDDPRSGRPPTATTQDKVDLALQMVMQDRRISCRQIAERLGISIEQADKILTQELGFSKVSARWVLRLLTPEQKRTRSTVSKGHLELFEADEDNFLARFITMDETKVHHFQPETKEQPKQWKHLSSPTQRRPRSFHQLARSWRLSQFTAISIDESSWATSALRSRRRVIGQLPNRRAPSRGRR